jgi:hypothetical protein
MMGHRARLSGGDEWDALTRGKRYHRWRCGERKWIKRKLSKRQRRATVLALDQKQEPTREPDHPASFW